MHHLCLLFHSFQFVVNTPLLSPVFLLQSVCLVHLEMKTKTRMIPNVWAAIPPRRIRSLTMPSTCGTRTMWSFLYLATKAPGPVRCCWPPSPTSRHSSHTLTAHRVTALRVSPTAQKQARKSRGSSDCDMDLDYTPECA